MFAGKCSGVDANAALDDQKHLRVGLGKLQQICLGGQVVNIRDSQAYKLALDIAHHTSQI